MQVTLPEDLERFIREQVASGEYKDASEVIGDALYARRAAFEELRAKVQVGIDQADRGEFADFDPERINRELDEELNA